MSPMMAAAMILIWFDVSDLAWSRRLNIIGLPLRSGGLCLSLVKPSAHRGAASSARPERSGLWRQQNGAVRSLRASHEESHHAVHNLRHDHADRRDRPDAGRNGV